MSLTCQVSIRRFSEIDDDDANFKSFLTSIKSFVITFEEFELDNCRTLTSFSDTLVSCVSLNQALQMGCTSVPVNSLESICCQHSEEAALCIWELDLSTSRPSPCVVVEADSFDGAFAVKALASPDLERLCVLDSRVSA